MQPAELATEHFVTYPPLARQVAVRGLEVLRRLPLAFVPLLLSEVIAYDSKFPAERQEVDAQFAFMSGLTPQRLRQVMARFERLRLLARPGSGGLGEEPGGILRAVVGASLDDQPGRRFSHRGGRLPQ